MIPTLPDRLSATIDSRISAYPSYTVEVDGLDVEISLANALEKLKDHYFTKLHMDMNRCMLSADRVAIVKFKRNMHVRQKNSFALLHSHTILGRSRYEKATYH